MNKRQTRDSSIKYLTPDNLYAQLISPVKLSRQSLAVPDMDLSICLRMTKSM